MKFFALVLLLAPTVAAVPFPGVVVKREDLLESYDYVIVGGGTSGLVLGNRLSGSAHNPTVLVIEAGPVLPDSPTLDVLLPRYAGPLLRGQYQWGYPYQPIAGLNGKVGTVLLGKVAGGGSAINGMYFMRGSKEDYDLWEDLGNPGWGWDGMLGYFKKSERYTEATPAQADKFGIESDLRFRGTDGPVEVGYPPWIYPQSESFLKANKKLNAPFTKDGNGKIGVYMAPNNLDPANITRSYSKTAYHNRAAGRPNYHLLPLYEVTKILFEDGRHGPEAVGVEYAAGPTAPRTQVLAKKEVIVAAGGVHSARVLQLSGIGDSRLLTKVGVPTVIDLPGVGSNFQDHPAFFFRHNANIPPNEDPRRLQADPAFDAAMKELYYSQKTGPWCVAMGSAAAFLSFPYVSSQASDIVNTAKSQNAAQFAEAGSHSNVIAGYQAQRSLILSQLSRNKMAAIEVLSPADFNPIIILQKPLSRGFIAINSSDPFQRAIISYRTYEDPFDVAMMVEGIKHGRKIFSDTEMKEQHSLVETVPGPAAQTDQQLEGVLRATGWPSLSHPSCSCPMMPRRLGGVVDSKLRVHGVKNLRVADTSIIPVMPSAHLMATAFAIGEKAADIILGR